MSVSLNEFSIEQLEALLFVVDEKVAEINGKLQAVSGFENGPIKKDIEDALNKAFDIFLLWRVQILNTLDEIRMGQKLSNN